MRLFFKSSAYGLIGIIFSILLSIGFCEVHADSKVSALEPVTPLTVDRISLVKQQLQVLHQRVFQAQSDLSELQKKEGGTKDIARQVLDKKRLDQLKLNLESMKMSWQAINMEVQDAKQSVQWLERSLDELQHQMNILTTLGIKSEADESNLQNLKKDQDQQQALWILEKNRLAQLQVLQNVLKSIYQIYQDQNQKMIYFQKTQEISMAEKKQVMEEWGYQLEQSQWLGSLDKLQKKISSLKNSKSDSAQFQLWDFENEAFYAEQQSQFYYLKSVLARYIHQVEEINRLSTKIDSVGLLNEMRSQIILLNEQSNHLTRLIQAREQFLLDRIQWLTQGAMEAKFPKQIDSVVASLQLIKQNYETMQPAVRNLQANLSHQQQHLEQLLKVELSARREFSNFGWKTVFDLGKEIILLPKLVYQFAKTNFYILKQDIQNISLIKWLAIMILEIGLLGIFVRAYRWLRSIQRNLYGSVSNMDARNLFLILLSHEGIDLFIVFHCLFWAGMSNVPALTYYFIQDLSLLWLFSKGFLKLFRLYTVESILSEEKNLLFRYRVFKLAMGLGGLLIFGMLLMLQLPLIDELKLITARILLFYFLLVSICWLYYSQMLSEMIVFHIQTANRYIHHGVKLIGFLLPLLLFMNSILGLLGYFNLITNIAKYEGIFLLVLFAYLVLRGLLNDVMEYFAQWTIQHAKNGWLISESVLKPLNKILRLLLLFFSIYILFSLYGWDKQSPVVMHLNEILHYPFFSILTSDVSLMTLFELAIWLAFFYWAARWVREFMYRFLSARTNDVGVRNSLAILSQYAVIVVGVFIVLRVLGIDYRALAFIVSAFALGAGLGLRDLVNNFACGFLILLERPLRVGDIVQVGEEQGEVIHFGSRAVTIRTDNYVEMIVPNNEIFSKTFINWTASNNTVRIVIPFFCDAQNDPMEIKSLIETILKSQNLILPFPDPEVYFKRIVENKIEFELRYYVDIRKVGTRAKATSAVLTEIFEAFKEKGYKLPTNEHHIYLKNQ